MEEDEINVYGFVIKKWHPLTELPSDIAESPQGKAADPEKPVGSQLLNPLLAGISDALIRLLWDILVYPYSSVSIRIKRLCISSRAYEDAKKEGLQKSLFLESDAGKTIHLIPRPLVFQAFNMKCPYGDNEFIEHNYYILWTEYMLSHNPSYRQVNTNVKIGESNAMADLVSVANDYSKTAWELTLTIGNILSNCTKYIKTDHKIVFLCRDYKLREAVKACFREGGLDPVLLARIDYMNLSQLLQRSRKLFNY